MMQLIYRHLLSKHETRVREKNTAFVDLTERHVQALWLEQKYFRSLVSAKGEPIQVLSPGIWNGEAGPDFLKARLRIGGELVEGDVEVHLWSAGWQQHGHQQDPRYNEVALHVVFWGEEQQNIAVNSRGESLNTAYMEPCLTLSLKQVLQRLDLDLYPYRQFLGSGRCAQTVFCRFSEDKVENLLQSAAHWRLEEKARFLHAWGGGRAFEAGLAMGLGYKQNAQAFLELWQALRGWLNEHPYVSADELFALALGMCGYFEARAESRWDSSDYYCHLRDLWWGQREEVTHQCLLAGGSTRPLNHPVRRLAYLVEWLLDPKAGHLFDELDSFWVAMWSSNQGQRQWRKLFRAFLTFFPSYSHTFFSHHLLFNSSKVEGKLSLLGKDARSAILLNTVFPLLYERIRQRSDPKELEVFSFFYQSQQAVASGKVRYLQHRFFGDSDRGDVLKKASAQQGAYQLHRDFCIHYESSCEGCPFVSRVQQSMSR